MPYNTLYGTAAGQSLTTGDYNTAVGSHALNKNQTGNNNVAVGSYSLENYTNTGSTAVGHFALQKSTSGARNTAIGQSAGSEVTTGARNVFLGWAAGWGTSQLATVNDSIAIGYQTFTDADGQIVVGTSSQNHFKMFGRSMARYTSSTNNLVLGSAGASPVTWTGTQNFGAGQNVLDSATTASSNCAVGTGALEELTVGNGNVVVGIVAGQFWEDVYDSVAIGNIAGRLATTGVGMTAVGYRSQEKATQARNQTSLGDSALWLSQGQGGVAVGYVAAEYVTSGEYSIYVGTHCGRNRADGDHNVFVGFQAGGFPDAVVDPDDGAGAVSAGDRNVGIGRAALKQATADDNTALGNQAGAALTSGSACVFIGSDAGNNGSQKVDAVNSIAIGKDAYTDKDNQVVLGNGSIAETVLRGVQRGATFTVAGLPSAATMGAGARAFVTDSNATSFNGVVAGGGSNAVPVFSDGVDWRIG